MNLDYAPDYIDPRAFSGRTTPCNIFGAGTAASAAAYVASNIFSWSEARKMPGRQADANKEVLEKQKDHYDNITKKQRDLLGAAISAYTGDMNLLLDNGSFKAALPSVPQAAEYVPVDACCMQGSTIECNISHIERAKAYTEYVNRQHEQNDLLHALSFDPGFLTNLDIVNKSFQDMMRGILDVGDVVEIVGDQAEMAALNGRIGNTRRTTARDLGISKHRVKVAGREEFRRHTTFINGVVSSQSRQHDITEMMQSPGARIQLALAQSQLIQNSLQNKNNALAQKEPWRLAELQLRMNRNITRLQAKSSQALLTNNFVPNYASTVVPKTDNISGLVGAVGSAIQNANSSGFFGPPSMSQDGYRGQPNGGDVYTSQRKTDTTYTPPEVYDEK